MFMPDTYEIPDATRADLDQALDRVGRAADGRLVDGREHRATVHALVEAATHDAYAAGFEAAHDDRLMLVDEVADEMRVSSMTIYRMITAGKLRAIRAGKNYRIRRSDLDDFYRRGEIAAREGVNA
jgi:excisionase family DNA binding protein